MSAYYDMGPLPDAEPYVRAARERSEMPAKLARVEQEMDAWKRLAMARGMRVADRIATDDRAERDAINVLRALGIDPATGERVAGEDPR